MSDHKIESLEKLREILPTNDKHNKNLNDRVFDNIDQETRKFIEDSPLVFFGTASDSGHVDVSPRGGEPGFVKVVDEKTLLFPEFRGNHDARNLRNILENNQVSLVFIIPKLLEVLRVTGRACITKDPALLDLLVSIGSLGKPPKLCLQIQIKECFLHCGRAFNLSHLWRPEEWAEPRKYKKRILDKDGKTTHWNINSGEKAELRKQSYQTQLQGKDSREKYEQKGVDVYGNKI